MNSLFTLTDEVKIGTVFKVDSYSVSVDVIDEEILRKVSVNGFVILQTANPNMKLIGRVDRVIRTEFNHVEMDESTEEELIIGSRSQVHINALGTLKGPGGGRSRPTFSRAVESLPEIGANCYIMNGERLTDFTSLIALETLEDGYKPLVLGSYTMAPDADALLDGNAFFQRHAMVVGSTGSGKSWTVARVIEQVADLPSSNMIVFDLHGEYSTLSQHENVVRYKIAGPGDLDSSDENIIFLPYWLLGYEDMLALILDRSDENAPNQAMAFSNTVITAKRSTLEKYEMYEELETFTIDSPIPYDMNYIIGELERLNVERIINESTNKPNNGPFNGKFNRFLPRLTSKISDRRHGFLFYLGDPQLKPDYLDFLVSKLMKSTSSDHKGVKIVDFSEVPSDILPIVVSLVARLVLHVQQWSNQDNRHPIALVCDEAHLYLPSRNLADAAEIRALTHFERIAKEGRKYGVSLLVISQRPSELNKTIISQCNNVISLRLSNQSDKSAVVNLLPENLSGIQDILPTLGIGEAIVVGDACLLPSRIKITEPTLKPNSDSVKFWNKWMTPEVEQDLSRSIRNMRRQTTR